MTLRAALTLLGLALVLAARNDLATEVLGGLLPLAGYRLGITDRWCEYHYFRFFLFVCPRWAALRWPGAMPTRLGSDVGIRDLPRELRVGNQDGNRVERNAFRLPTPRCLLPLAAVVLTTASAAVTLACHSITPSLGVGGRTGTWQTMRSLEIRQGVEAVATERAVGIAPIIPVVGLHVGVGVLTQLTGTLPENSVAMARPSERGIRLGEARVLDLPACHAEEGNWGGQGRQ